MQGSLNKTLQAQFKSVAIVLIDFWLFLNIIIYTLTLNKCEVAITTIHLVFLTTSRFRGSFREGRTFT